MSKNDKTAAANAANTEVAAPRKVALLIAGPAGLAGAVVELPATDADVLVAAGQADDNPAAVAYRESVAGAPAGETVLS